ncbi:hypothetical protein EYF80_035975 [Liparis tanakae]|uniref:Uncharacterized protein n=1 Tax=Liparis tanakae TaxID=230148 RepID=A0A4Z2GKT8_9TELE|nr:hypothetical protein EYF80_035975 [Liparis tanakae]
MKLLEPVPDLAASALARFSYTGPLRGGHDADVAHGEDAFDAPALGCESIVSVMAPQDGLLHGDQRMNPAGVAFSFHRYNPTLNPADLLNHPGGGTLGVQLIFTVGHIGIMAAS